MEDDKLKDLFSNFQPELSSSFQFMNRLQKNMEAVEIVKRHNIALKRRNKIAVAIAAVSGLAMGIVLTLIFQLVDNWISTYSISLPHLQISAITIDYSFITWIVMAGVCVITAMNAYEITLANLSYKETTKI